MCSDRAGMQLIAHSAVKAVRLTSCSILLQPCSRQASSNVLTQVLQCEWARPRCNAAHLWLLQRGATCVHPTPPSVVAAAVAVAASGAAAEATAARPAYGRCPAPTSVSIQTATAAAAVSGSAGSAGAVSRSHATKRWSAATTACRSPCSLACLRWWVPKPRWCWASAATSGGLAGSLGCMRSVARHIAWKLPGCCLPTGQSYRAHACGALQRGQMGRCDLLLSWRRLPRILRCSAVPRRPVIPWLPMLPAPGRRPDFSKLAALRSDTTAVGLALHKVWWCSCKNKCHRPECKSARCVC